MIGSYLLIVETESGPAYLEMRRGTAQSRRYAFDYCREQRAKGYTVRVYRPQPR